MFAFYAICHTIIYMLNVNLLRENPDAVKKGIAAKNLNSSLVDDFLAIDATWRNLTKEVDDLRAELNRLSKERNIEDAKKVKEKIKDAENQLPTLEKKRDDILSELPNMPMDGWLTGKDETENKVLRQEGKQPSFDFEPKDYLTLAENLGIIDVERAGKVSGSRFGYLLGEAALLEFALVNFAFEKLTAKGFTPVIPPVMIKPDIYRGMGRLSKSQEEERYYLPKDDLYLVGSAEHTMGPFHAGETLNEKDLPKRYVGFSTCFRREAGSYGKDTKGILRVHQFDKVEMFSFVKPEESESEHKFLLSVQEELMSDLGLPYQVVQICTGDMGFTDAAQYDVETWLPGQGKYRETHSCSNTTDFQARGVNIKYKSKEGGRYVHMLNATGFAMSRMPIAIIENYQTKDGGVRMPEVLHKYLPFKEIKSQK